MGARQPPPFAPVGTAVNRRRWLAAVVALAGAGLLPGAGLARLDTAQAPEGLPKRVHRQSAALGPVNLASPLSGAGQHGGAILRFRGMVGGGIYRAARAAGAPAAAVQQYLRLLDVHLGLDREVLPADTFEIVVAPRRTLSGAAVAGTLLYAGLERKGQPRLQLVRGKDGRFHDASGARAGGDRAGAPVAGPITSRFGPRRHPILGFVRMHRGLDFQASRGTPVRAAYAGRVVAAGWHGGHGNHVRLAHGEGVGTGYSHLGRIVAAPGAAVAQGEVIGYVGSTGLSTGPHLHYELYRNGRAVDPASVAGLPAPDASAPLRARVAALRKVPAIAARPVSAPLPRPGSASAAAHAARAD